MFFSDRYVFPIEVFTFLGHSDVATLSLVNRRSVADTFQERKRRRRLYAAELMRCFYRPIYSIFSLPRSEEGGTVKKIRSLFSLLPELFMFFIEKRVRAIDLETQCDITFALPLVPVIQQILSFVKEHSFVSYCNLTLFKEHITIDMIEPIGSIEPPLHIVPHYDQPPTLFYRTAK